MILTPIKCSALLVLAACFIAAAAGPAPARARTDNLLLLDAARAGGRIVSVG